MTTYYLAGDAQQAAAVKQQQITAYHASSVYTITIAGKTVSQAATGGTATTTATAFAATLALSTIPEFAELTWTSNTDTVIATSNSTNGKTHDIFSSVVGGTGTMGGSDASTAFATVTAPSGENALIAGNIKNAATGVRGALPGNSDTLKLEALDVDLLYGLEALAAVTGLTIDIAMSFEGLLGLPLLNQDGTAYSEPRQRFLQTSGGTCTIGRGEGSGSGRIMWDAGSGAATLIIQDSGDPDDDNYHAVIFKGTNAANILRASGGSFDIAPFANDTAVIASAVITGDAVGRFSANCTLGSLTIAESANVEVWCSTTSYIRVYDRGKAIVRGTGTHTELTAYGATAGFVYEAGDVGLVHLWDSASWDCSEAPADFEVTTLVGSGTPTIDDSAGRMSIVNAIDTQGGNFFDWEVTTRAGRGFTWGS